MCGPEPTTHVHDFAPHVGIKFAAGTLMAWVPESKVENVSRFDNKPKLPTMFKCLGCGEQGYEIRRPA